MKQGEALGEQEVPKEEKEEDLGNLSTLTIAELEEELRKKRELEARYSIYTNKGAFTEADKEYIREKYGIAPDFAIKLAPNDLPKGVPKSLEYLDEISPERQQSEKLIILKHFPE